MANKTDITNLIKRLDELQRELNIIRKQGEKRINAFRAIGMVSQEVKHSAFIAWLFNPTSPHNLYKEVLKWFLEELYNYDSVGSSSGTVIAKSNKDILKNYFATLNDFTELLNDNDISVATEVVICDKENRLDLLVTFREHQTVIVIENKVFAKLGNDQLERYENELQKNLSPYKQFKKIYVYLRNDNSLPTVINKNGDTKYKDTWCIFDYNKIKSIIKKAYDNVKNSKGKDRTKLLNLLEDYMDILDNEILMNNTDLRRKCKEITSKYAEELAILNEYSDNGEAVVDYCFKWLKNNIASFKLYKSASISINFYSDGLEAYFNRKNEKLSKNLARYYCGSDGDIIGCFLMSKDGNWTGAQEKIIESEKGIMDKNTHKDSRVTVILLDKEKRGYSLDNIKDELDRNLNIFKKRIEEFENKLQSI